MLTKKSKQLLDAINKLHDSGIDYPTMDDLKSAVNFSEKDIMLIALYLKENNYVHVDFGSGDTILLIESKFKGKNYRELIKMEKIHFIKNSIIVPILVSVTSSILFWLIK